MDKGLNPADVPVTAAMNYSTHIAAVNEMEQEAAESDESGSPWWEEGN